MNRQKIRRIAVILLLVACWISYSIGYSYGLKLGKQTGIATIDVEK